MAVLVIKERSCHGGDVDSEETAVEGVYMWYS